MQQIFPISFILSTDYTDLHGREGEGATWRGGDYATWRGGDWETMRLCERETMRQGTMGRGYDGTKEPRRGEIFVEKRNPSISCSVV